MDGKGCPDENPENGDPAPDDANGRSARRVLIKRLCVRDASFIAANMRRQDFREIACLWETWDTRALGICAVETAVPGMVWSIWYEGQPAAAFGFSRASAFDPDHWQAWAFGTDRFKRCVPRMTQQFVELRPRIERDCRRLQVITHKDHDIAHGWIEALGATQEGLLRSYGRGGEDFYVYAWVRQGADRRSGSAPGPVPVDPAPK
ncbi:MAG: hypothetical protein ABJL00_04560 [Roseibium sp.]|uniref:hypothetical protein n=2 Tax=Roseibium sp. TaxID=1936156 RepID=UPI00326511A3